MNFDLFISSLRELLLDDDSPLTLQNGIWTVLNRRQLWKAMAPRVFDAHLDQLQTIAIEVLSEIDPKFELPEDERFAANIHGKVLKYSPRLRIGIAETLALIGNFSEDLINCSNVKAAIMPIQVIRDVFTNADWYLWSSLNDRCFVPKKIT